MILEKETFDCFGYIPSKLPRTSNKKVICKCDCCGGTFHRKHVNISLAKHPGLTTCNKTVCSQFKIKTVNMHKYGVTNAMQSPIIRERAAKTCLSRYNTSSPLKAKSVQDKIKKTLIEKYGVDNPFKLQDVQDRIKELNLQKYGVENIGETLETKLKIKQTNMRKYGVEHAFQAEQTKSKIKQTLIENFGVDNPQKSPEIRAKTEQTCIEKYGVKTALALQTSRQSLIESNIAKYGSAYPASKNHKTEDEIRAWLLSLGFEFNPDYQLTAPKEIDLYNKDKAIAIEYCGLYWHTETSMEPRDRNYHYGKYKMCQDKGVQLITIFEDEWKERNTQCKNFIKATLGVGERIHARKCVVEQIDKTTANKFIDENHIQGSNKLGLVFFGLKYNERLVGVMSLGYHHRGNSDLVLDRLCFLDNAIVMGGASKLFNQAVIWAKSNEYKEIKSWSDNRWSKGNVYLKLGFKLLNELKPDYSYVNMSGYKPRLSKQSQRKAGSNCPLDMTELEWASQRNLSRIWDCGKKAWQYEIK